MNKKTYFIVFVASIYFIFIALFSNLEYDRNACEEESEFESTCVSFCSKDENAVSDELIRENFQFNETFLAEIYDNYTIQRGMPNCLTTKSISKTKEIIDYDYAMSVESYYFSPHRYCNQLVEKYGEYKWEMIVCDNDSTLQMIFHAFVIISSTLLFAFMISVYVYFYELHDYYGKCMLNFLCPLLIIFILQPTLHYDEFLSVTVGNLLTMVMEVLYIFYYTFCSAMCFDMFLTFLQFCRDVPTLTNKLQKYIFFSVGITAFSLILYLTEYHALEILHNFIWTTFLLILMHKTIAVLDICFIVGALICKFLAMRNLYDTELSTKFNQETEWFWIRFMLIFISMATFPIEILAWRTEESIEVFLIADTLKLICAISFFGILICGREQVMTLIIKKYSELKSLAGTSYIISQASEEV